MTKDKTPVTEIYTGGFVPDLAIMNDVEHHYFGWLMYKHPDGEWVSLCDLSAYAEIFATNAVKMDQRAMTKLLMELRRDAETEKMLRIGGLYVLAADGVITQDRAAELAGCTHEEMRAEARAAMKGRDDDEG